MDILFKTSSVIKGVGISYFVNKLRSLFVTVVKVLFNGVEQDGISDILVVNIKSIRIILSAVGYVSYFSLIQALS